MGFAEKLVEYRKAYNMTQEALAERCNVTRQAVAKWEKEESLPDVYLISRLANIFGVTIEDMIWSTKLSKIENKKYFVREAEDSDMDKFRPFVRENKIFRVFFNWSDENGIYAATEKTFWDTHREGGTFYLIQDKSDNSFAGYIYVESPETSAPHIMIQISKRIEFGEADYNVIYDFLNWISRQYNMRAAIMFINSDVEKRMFEKLGYKNIKDEVMVSLPV